MSIDFKNYRIDDIQRKIDYIGVQPLDVMVTGVTGAGKSTTLNTFFQKYVAKVGDGVDPETMELDAYSLNDYLRLWDTPGLGDGVDKDEIHKKKIIELLNKTYTDDGREYGFIDMVLVIIEGANRDMGTTYKILNDVIVPNISKYRILVLINQADMAMKGRHWDYKLNKLKLTEVSRNSAKRAWWQCRYGHSWSMKINECTVLGKGCRICEQEYVSEGYKVVCKIKEVENNTRVILCDFLNKRKL